MQAQIGDFLFDSNSSNLEEIKRTLSFDFSSQQRLKNFISQTDIGAYQESIEFQGTIIAKSQNKLKDLISQGKSKKETTLTFGTGESMSVIILNIDIQQSLFLDNGSFLKQSFTISLQRVYK